MPSGYKERLDALERELQEKCTKDGAWVEPKGLLVAWHYREVSKESRDSLMELAESIYTKHGYEFFNVSKRLENVPPVGWDRGRSSIHILRSIFGMDWEEMVQVIYAGDSAADESAMEVLKGVAYTFKVMNEDATAITKTWANARLQGPDSVLTMLKYLEKKLSGRRIKKTTRTSLCSLDLSNERIQVVMDEEPCTPGETPRPRSSSFNLTRKLRPRAYSHASAPVPKTKDLS